MGADSHIPIIPFIGSLLCGVLIVDFRPLPPMRIGLLIRAFLVACAVTSIPFASGILIASYSTSEFWRRLAGPLLMVLVPGTILSTLTGVGDVLPRTLHYRSLIVIFVSSIVFYTAVTYLILRSRERRMLKAGNSL